MVIIVCGTVPVVGIVKVCEIPRVVVEDCCAIASVVEEDCCNVLCTELDEWKVCVRGVDGRYTVDFEDDGVAVISEKKMLFLSWKCKFYEIKPVSYPDTQYFFFVKNGGCVW